MSPEMRIGDVEREAAVTALGEHYAAGRLTKDEYDERSERAWAARTASQLAPLFTDLPMPHYGRPTLGSATGRSVPPGRSVPAVRERGFRLPLLPVLAIFVGVALLVGHPWIFWVMLGLFLWGRGSFRHAQRRRSGQQGPVPPWMSGWHGPRKGW